MMQVGDMKFIDFEETLDRDLGPVGTPKRDEFERNVDILADSESMMKRVDKYLNKLVMEKKSDPTEMTKEEFLQRIDDARKGKTYRMKPEESLDEFLDRVG